MSSLPSIYGLTRADLTRALEVSLGRGEEPSTASRRSEAFFRALYRELEPLPRTSIRGASFDALFATHDFAPSVHVREDLTHKSEADGSVKFAMELSDGLLVESVLIPERGRLTLCLSTQVGCAQGCRFCQTGRMGLLRSLGTHEIVGQVVASARWLSANVDDVDFSGAFAGGPKRISNVVFMGMGEPLDNLEGLLPALDILIDPKGLGLSPNKVTVSTVGLLPQLGTFLDSSPVCLALSLHSPFDDERSRVMPVNARHPVADVLFCLREHAERYGRRFMFQYTLIRNINDSPAHAEALATLLSGLPAKVNLIPLNEHEGTAYRRPGVGPVYAFQTLLKERGLVATVRLSKGRDIQAACGQLIKGSRPATPVAATRA